MASHSGKPETTKTMKQPKPIKAWFVDVNFPGKMKWFSGPGVKTQARIYRTKKIARSYWPPEPNTSCIPVLITPIKPKT